jgi:arsenite methyltransferase
MSINLRKACIISFIAFQLVLIARSAAVAGTEGYMLNSTEDNILRMESPSRAQWQKPDDVVEQLSIKQGDVTADIGAGTGYFTVLMSKATGSNGIVYAVDIDPKMVDYLAKRAAQEGLSNVRSVKGLKDDPLLPSSSVDLIFMCNTYLFIDQREQYLGRLKEALKHNGRIAVISYKKMESTKVGPPLHRRISRETTIAEFEKSGLTLNAEYFFLPYQYYLIFVKH